VATTLPHVTISRGPVASIWPHPPDGRKTMQNNVKIPSTITHLLLVATYSYNITRFAQRNILLTCTHLQCTKYRYYNELRNNSHKITTIYIKRPHPFHDNFRYKWL